MRLSRPFSVLLLAVLIGITSTAHPAHAGEGRGVNGAPLPLGDLLQPDGSLDMSTSYGGTLDPSGWSLVSGRDGAPRFVPRAEGMPGSTSLWDERFPYPGTNGTVNAVAVLNGDLFVGGDFTEAGGIPVRGLARWNGAGWYDVGGGLSTRGAVDPLVNALAVSGDSLIVGGFFTFAGNVEALNLASWDGATWSPIGGGVGDVVHVILPYEGKIYVGGRFTAASAITARRIAVWDGATWATYGDGLGTVNADALVYSIAVTGDTVYVGGDFLLAGGQPANRVAMWDGAVWSALGDGVDGGVRALALFQGSLYVGGFIQNAGDVEALSIARWDGAEWSSVLNGADGVVRDFLVFGDTLVVAGEFLEAGGISAPHVALWNGTAWGTRGGLNGAVRSLFEDADGSLYAGGDFGSGEDQAAHRVARWDGQAWRTLGQGVEGTVHAITVGHGGVYIGGEFTVAGGALTNGIAFWNGSGWEPLGEGTDGPVFSIALDENDENSVYVGGSFNTAGGNPLTNVARWDGGEWVGLGSGVNGPCMAVAVDEDGRLYAGGAFNQAGGVSTGRIAQWDGLDWTVLGTGIPSPFTVNTLVADGPDLWVGGRFDGVGGTTAQNIARWDGSTWHRLGDGVNDEVLDIAVSGSDVYAVGRFTVAGGQQSTGIGHWDGSTWSVELGAGLDNRPLLTVDVVGDTVYTGGTFEFIGDVIGNGIARWADGVWDSLETGMDGEVRVIAAGSSDVYVGGAFRSAGGLASHNFARWDASGVVPVNLLSFTAERRDHEVRLRWAVAGASADHAGFHVHRADAGAPRVRLTESLLSGSRIYDFVDASPPAGRAEYWLEERTRAGAGQWYGPATVDPSGIGSRLILAQNRPNPFRAATRIGFSTGVAGPVQLRIFDLAGRQVRLLLNDHLPVGIHEAEWDRRDDRGGRVASGVYFYRLDSREGSINRKLVILP